MSVVIPKYAPSMPHTISLGTPDVPQMTITAAEIKAADVTADAHIGITSDYQDQIPLRQGKTSSVESAPAILDNGGRVIRHIGHERPASHWQQASLLTAVFHDAIQMHPRAPQRTSAGDITVENAMEAIRTGLALAAVNGHRSVCIDANFSLLVSTSKTSPNDHLDSLACFKLILSALALYRDDVNAGNALPLEEVVVAVTVDLFDHFTYLRRHNLAGEIFAALVPEPIAEKEAPKDPKLIAKDETPA